MGFLNLVLAVTTAVTYAEKGTLFDDDKVVVDVDDAQYVRTNEQFRTIRAEGGVVDLLGTSVFVGGTTAHPGQFVIGNLHKMSNYSGYLWMGYDSSIYFQKGVEMAPNEKFDIPEGFETLDVRYSDMMDRKIAGVEDEFMKAGGPSVVSNDFQIAEVGAEQGVLLKWKAAAFADVDDGNDSAWLWQSPFWLLQGYSRGVWLGDWTKGYSWGLFASTNRTMVLIRDANHGGGTKGEGEAVASIEDISRAMNSDKVTLGSLNTTAKTVNVGTNTLESVIDAAIADKGLTDGFWLSEGVTTLDTTDIPGVDTASSASLDPDSAGGWTVDYSWVTNGVVVYQTDVRETDEGVPIAGKLPLIRAGVPYDTPSMNEAISGFGGIPGGYNSSFYHPFSSIYSDSWGGSVKVTPPLFYGASLMLASPEYKPDAIWLWRGYGLESGLPRWLLSDEDVRQHFVESVDFSTGTRRFTDPWLFYGIDRTADMYATEGYNMYGVRWMPDEFATISTLMGDVWYAGTEVYKSGDFGERIATLPEVGRRLGHMLSRISVDDPAMRHWGFTNVVQIGDATVTADVLKVGTNTLREVIETLAPVPDTSAFVTKTELDSSVKTAVNKYKDLEYDTALEVTWTRVVNDGHIYYIAVTNVNTSVAE